MSVLVIDSFDWNGNTIINSRYLSIASTPTFSNVQTKHGSGYSLFVNATGERIYYDIGSQDGNRLIIGFYIYFTSISPSARTDLVIISGSATQCMISLNEATRKLEVRTALGVILGTGSQIIQLNTWYQIEWKIKVINSTASGDCIIKIDGIEDINLVGVDTQYRATNEIDRVGIGTSSVSTNIYYDDFYVLDTNGTYANDFIGPYVRIESLEPDGNGNSNDFVGSDADSVDNYLHVDESPADDDTSYVQSSIAGQKDGYTFDNLAGSVDSIMAVQTMTRHKKVSGAGPRTAKHFIRRSAADYEGSVIHTLSDGTYENDLEIWDEDPSLTAQWIETNVNALEAGIKVQT